MITMTFLVAALAAGAAAQGLESPGPFARLVELHADRQALGDPNMDAVKDFLLIQTRRGRAQWLADKAREKRTAPRRRFRAELRARRPGDRARRAEFLSGEDGRRRIYFADDRTLLRRHVAFLAAIRNVARARAAR